MSSRQQKVLQAINEGPVSTETLAFRLNAPVPSIRRIIGELRSKGNIIVHAGKGVYRLTAAQVEAREVLNGDTNAAVA